MDGTLWDNVDNYVKSWNVALEEKGFSPTLSREKMMGLMGIEARKILNELFPEESAKNMDELFEEISIQYNKLAPKMVSKVYPYVIEGLEQLNTKYKLFLLSNCEKGGLVKFMNYTKTNQLFLDYMEHGQNNMPKSFNLNILRKKHNLKSPVYIGDTEGDRHQAALARIPFVFVTYGFGETEHFNLQFNSFKELTEYYMFL